MVWVIFLGRGLRRWLFGVMKRAMSSMCPSVSSPWMPVGSQMNFLMPSDWVRIFSICDWVRCGFLFFVEEALFCGEKCAFAVDVY